MSDVKEIRLDWQKLLGFDQAELRRDHLQQNPTSAALIAKLSGKPCTRSRHSANAQPAEAR